MVQGGDPGMKIKATPWGGGALCFGVVFFVEVSA